GSRPKSCGASRAIPSTSTCGTATWSRSMSSETHHHPRPTSPIEDRVAALEELLVEKGIIDRNVMDDIVEHFEHELGPMNGAKVVARAWVDPEYKQRLLTDGTAAIAELGF